MKILSIATYVAVIGLAVVIGYSLVTRSSSSPRAAMSIAAQPRDSAIAVPTTSGITSPRRVTLKAATPDSNKLLKLGSGPKTQAELLAALVRWTRMPVGLSDEERATLIVTALKTVDFRKWETLPFYDALLPGTKRELQLRVLRADPDFQAFSQVERSKLLARLDKAFPESDFRFEKFIAAQPGFPFESRHERLDVLKDARNLDQRFMRMTSKDQARLFAEAERYFKR